MSEPDVRTFILPGGREMKVLFGTAKWEPEESVRVMMPRPRNRRDRQERARLDAMAARLGITVDDAPEPSRPQTIIQKCRDYLQRKGSGHD